MGAKGLLAAAIVLAALAWLPIPASAALLKSVTSGTVNLPNVATPTQIALTGVDITKAFVTCSQRSVDSTPSRMLYTCDLNNGGAGGAAQLTITPSAAPGGATSFVQYYVAEFAAGVSVQRGTATFSGTGLAPTAAPALSTVDCTKSFLLTSVRSTQTLQTVDEQWTVRATLGTAAAPCTTTTNNLQLQRLAGAAGTTLTVAWQVITYEGASVQRGALGTSCIGGAAATPACPTAGGATDGLNNRITLATGVDTTKSFILFTQRAGTLVAGVEGEYLVRAQFLATGASVTGVQFVRALTATANNRHVQISWEVVTLNDGSTVQSSGTTPTVIAAATASASPNLTTLVDATRTVAILSASGGGAGGTGTFNDVVATGTIAASDGAAASEVVLTRTDTTVASTIAWFAVSFFRCTTASGLGHDRLCTVGASTTSNQATVDWTSPNTVVIVRNTASTAGNPANGTNYCTNAGAGCTTTIGGSAVVYPSVVTPPSTDTSFPQGGLTTSPTTTYFYKVWAKNPTAVGACTTPPCYVTGTEVSVTPRLGATTWSSIVSGGSALNPAVPNSSGNVSMGSNAGKLTTFNAASGAWASAPLSTSGVNQGYLTVIDVTGGEAALGGDTSGFVYSVNPATAAINWLVKLNADSVVAPLTVYSRAWFSAAMTATYPGTYDLIFAATANNTATGGFTNNTIIALRSDTGAPVWTYTPGAMDQILGQPSLDYGRDRLYWTSRNGQFGTQQSLWILNVATNPGTLVVSFSGTNNDFTTAPSQSFDGDLLFAGDEAGKLHVVDLTAAPPTRTTPYLGASAFRGFVWEDFNNWGVLYFVTADGFVNSLATPTSSTTAWRVKPSGTGTVNQVMPGEFSLWAGGSDGILYQLNLGTGATEKTFTVGDGTKAVGPVSAGNIDEVIVATSDGRVSKITLTNQSLP